MILEVSVAVECDECGEELEIVLSDLNDAAFQKALKDAEWSRGLTAHGEAMLCPACDDPDGEPDDA
jgi:hypothetical protein